MMTFLIPFLALNMTIKNISKSNDRWLCLEMGIKKDAQAQDIVIDDIGLKWNCTYDN